MVDSHASPSPESAQYQHFVPQFILRNFAHLYRPSKGQTRTRGGIKQGKKHRQSKDRLYPGDQALHLVDLSSDDPQLIEHPVRRSFGLTDMYRDFSRASDQHYLEKHLSKLESQASMIVTKIRKTFESGSRDVWISRVERDMLRKFLFIMKYRGKSFHKRFVGDEMKSYVAEDKDLLLEYMNDHGFATPLDVWFASIKTILELKMDVQGAWKKNLPIHMYPMDAEWFIMHTEMMYLALCTPDNVNAEFVLTENSYNIYEGPTTVLIDPLTGEDRPGPWTNYHEFSPISPKLIIVLRSFLLPNAEEDASESIRAWREKMYTLNQSFHANPSAAHSLLSDLPISKARNSYSVVGNHGIKLLEHEDGSRRSHHRFCFQFFSISTKHVNQINAIMLENAHHCQAIAYESTSGLQMAIEHYLTLSPDQGLKVVSDRPDNPRLAYLKKLEYVLRHLGSDKRLVYRIQTPMTIIDGNLEMLQNDVANSLPDQPTEFMQLYMKLGGRKTTLFYDMDQARRMIKLRIKIDVWSQGLEESRRKRIRGDLRDIYCQLPVQRLWFYLKQVRCMETARGPDTLGDVLRDSPEIMDGPEDTIVRACCVIQPEKMGRLMYFSVVHQVYLMKNPELGRLACVTLDQAGLTHLVKLTDFAFGSAGTICDCGIEEIQEKSRLVRARLESTQTGSQSSKPFWTTAQNVEMLVRLSVRDEMQTMLGHRLSNETLSELKEVLFDIIYLTNNVGFE